MVPWMCVNVCACIPTAIFDDFFINGWYYSNGTTSVCISTARTAVSTLSWRKIQLLQLLSINALDLIWFYLADISLKCFDINWYFIEMSGVIPFKLLDINRSNDLLSIANSHECDYPSMINGYVGKFRLKMHLINEFMKNHLTLGKISLKWFRRTIIRLHGWKSINKLF